MSDTNAIVPGSLQAIAQQNQTSLAETFLNVDAIVIADTSGSMGAHDAPGGRSRYEMLLTELETLQAQLPGKIAVIAFSNRAELCPAGVPTFFGGGTDLAGALTFVKVADLLDVRFFVLSDGEPHDEAAALAVAQTFQNRIDVIYIGPDDRPEGRKFLERLAEISGGQLATADRAANTRNQILLLIG